MKQDIFGAFHPVINFVYFVLVIGCSMFLMHPVFPISAVVNPLFNHKGVTLIFYLTNGNPLTLESI